MSLKAKFIPSNAKQARSSIERPNEHYQEPYRERSLNTCFGTPLVPDSTKGFYSFFRRSNPSPKGEKSS